MTTPRITCLFHTNATITALLHSSAGESLTGDLLVECSRRPSLGLVLNLETPATYPGVAGLLGGVDPATLAHHADVLPAPIILAAGEEVAIDAMRSALVLLRRPDVGMKHVTFLVPVGAARSLGAALAVCDRFAIGWDVGQFPHEELVEFARWLGTERLIERSTFAGVFPYATVPIEAAHRQKISALLVSLGIAGAPTDVLVTSR